jgi:hypothetical protein
MLPKIINAGLDEAASAIEEIEGDEITTSASRRRDAWGGQEKLAAIEIAPYITSKLVVLIEGDEGRRNSRTLLGEP